MQTQPKPRRKFFRRLLLVLVLVVVGVAAACLISSNSEPEYKGIALSKWLGRYSDNVDADPQRTEAAEAVRHIGPKAVPSLLKWAAATDSPLKQKAEEWMGEHFPSLGVSLTDADDLHERAFTGFHLLGQQGKTAIPDLQRLLYNTNSADTAARVLCLFSPETTPILITGLTNANADIRSAVASAISEWNQTTEVPSSTHAGRKITLPVAMLLDLLHDSESELQAVGIQGLGEAAARKALQPQATVPLLIQQLTNQDMNCRFEAANALTNFGSDAKDAIPVLLDILKSGSNPEIAAGSIGLPSSNFTFTLGTGSAALAGQAVSSQVTIKFNHQNWVSLPVSLSGTNAANVAFPASDYDGGYVVHSLQALHADPSQVISVLERRLDSPDLATRYWAVGALGSYGSQAKSSVPLLLQIATSPDASLRLAVLCALERIDPETARSNSKLLDVDYRDSKLIPFEKVNLLNTEPFARRVAAYRLGNFGAAASSAVPELEALLSDKNEAVRVAVTNALKKIDPEAAAKAGVK